MTTRTLIVALLLGASVAGGSQLMKLQLTASPEQQVSEVLVLMQDVPRGKMRKPEMLATRKYLTSALPFGGINKMEDAVGRVSTIALRKGVLFENALAPKGSLAGLQGMIPDNKRAFMIRTPNVASGLAGLVQPGDHVDVLLTVDHDADDEDTGGGAVVTLLQDIEVLAVDQHLDGAVAAPVSEKKKSNGAAPQVAIKSVTLIASPADAMRLSLAQTKGTLQLSLRSPGAPSDDDGIGLVAVTFNDLLGRAKKVVHAKAEQLVADTRSVAKERQPTEVAAPVAPMPPAPPVTPVLAAAEQLQVAKLPEPPSLPPIVMFEGNSWSSIDLSLVQGRHSVSRYAPIPSALRAK